MVEYARRQFSGPLKASFSSSTFCQLKNSDDDDDDDDGGGYSFSR